MSLTVACVNVGTKYSTAHVARLQTMVRAHLPVPHRFVCLTDKPAPPGVQAIEAVLGLTGWWQKMALFSPRIRGAGRVLYLDLDTAIVGSLAPLASWFGTFGICESFTRLAGHSSWPCAYGSCVMSFADGWGADIWQRFWSDRAAIMTACKYGDQQAIEQLVPSSDVTLLQRVMPANYLISYRALADNPHGPPDGTAVVNFGGRNKPDTCTTGWIRRAYL